VPSSSMFQHKFSVAPMMEYTDCYKRQLQRLLTHQAVLYTEMFAANALTTTGNADASVLTCAT
jgi:tRNA-dihydrouridine synthase A